MSIAHRLGTWAGRARQHLGWAPPPGTSAVATAPPSLPPKHRAFWVYLAFAIIFGMIYLLAWVIEWQLMIGLQDGIYTMSDSEWEWKRSLLNILRWVELFSGLAILLLAGLTLLTGLVIVVRAVFRKAFHP